MSSVEFSGYWSALEIDSLTCDCNRFILVCSITTCVLRVLPLPLAANHSLSVGGSFFRFPGVVFHLWLQPLGGQCSGSGESNCGCSACQKAPWISLHFLTQKILDHYVQQMFRVKNACIPSLKTYIAL